MNLKLVRTEYGANGVFSELYDENGIKIATTLEHAYPAGSEFLVKIPAGQWTCRRGTHRLEGMDHDFETFEITGVPGHKNLLFHVGNYNHDSSGCILLGQYKVGEMIVNSKTTFDKFMALQNGVDQFILTVT